MNLDYRTLPFCFVRLPSLRSSKAKLVVEYWLFGKIWKSPFSTLLIFFPFQLYCEHKFNSSLIVGVLKFFEYLSDHNIWRRKSQTWPNKRGGTFIFSISYPMFANRAAKEIQQPHTANRPNLAAFLLRRADLQLPQFWSDFSEILDLDSIKN